tara:strand:- start:169 stop:396 length:228 start_codon:yes stop_codon:yes gene_type:complete
MTSLDIRDFNEEVDNKMSEIKKLRKQAEVLTLTEMVEQNFNINHYTIANTYYSVNPQNEISYDEAIKSIGGTTPD